MKKLFYYLTIMLFVVAFYGCEEGKEEVWIDVSRTDVELNANKGASTTVDVKSNTSWSVSSNAEWCTVSPNGESGNQTITISTATENTTGIDRIAIISVSVSYEIKQTITVTQDDISVSKSVIFGTLLISDRNVGAPMDGVAYNYNNDYKHPDYKHSDFRGRYYTWEQTHIVCPGGWRLPTYEQMRSIASAMKFSEGRAYLADDEGNKCYFPLSGIKWSPTRNLGAYWSASGGSSSTYAFSLYLRPSSSSISYDSTSDNYSKSVRCVKTAQ